jgi:uncharacterized protein with PIN domain
LIYLDSCALIKLVVDEPGSKYLDAHLAKHNSHQVLIITSELSYVEVHRALTRLESDET